MDFKLLVEAGVGVLLFLLGCSGNSLKTAEEYIAAGEYASAVQVLSSAAVKGDVKHLSLLAEALFVEGDMPAGFQALNQARQDEAAAGELSRALLAAARVIVREKERCRYTAQLLDSALVIDPAAKQEALDLAWTRALEYLQVPGDGALHLLKFAERYDQYINGRLHGYDAKLAQRYEEMKIVERLLVELNAGVERFSAEKGCRPGNIIELTANYPYLDPVSQRAGWRFSLANRDSGMPAQAEALAKNPAGVPAGTTISIYE
ncbi:MAG: hypothetical protein FJY65_04560 [Calditrichaeota bacterium]|nr:hypothetical protein [Calditrichota bacterium]